jgi:phage repressor protein C with HTH and peptisase S24 domain
MFDNRCDNKNRNTLEHSKYFLQNSSKNVCNDVSDMGTGKEIKRLRLKAHLSAEKAAKAIGVDPDRLRKWESKGLEPRDKDALTISDFFGVELDRLNTLQSFNFFQKVPRETEATAVNFLEQRREQKNNDEPYLVPYIDIPAQAGYTKAYQQRDYIATLKKYPILPDVDPTGAVWRYFAIAGTSMETEFKEGDIILCSQVNSEDWQDIKNYHTHVIVTDEDLLIKDIYRESTKEWILLSQNEEFPPTIMKVEDIRQVWVMRRHVKARAKKNRMYDITQIRKQLKK